MRLDDNNDLNVGNQGNSGGGFGGFGGGGGGFGGGGFGGGGGLGGLALGFLPLIFSKLGCVGTAIVLGLLLFFGGGLGGLLGGGGGGGAPAVQQSAPSQVGQSDGQGGGTNAQICDASTAKRLSCNVVASANGVWSKLLQGYQPPKLQFYDRNGQSGCGAAQAAMGPFYCPADQGVYLDETFYDELQRKFGAPGDAAQAYVIAHEVGHHVQHLTGVADRVQRERGSVGRSAGNAAQVKMELQADCYAGVWAATARTRDGQPVLEAGDVQEAMGAAQAIGDDTLQQQSQGRVSPESFTHGTSAQRQFWLNRGLESGDPRQCDTFAGTSGNY